MTAKDWFDVIFALGTVALAVIASVYTRYKAKIDTKSAAGKTIDTIGKLAVWAVNEAEYSGMGGTQKREYAAEIITEQLQKKGITGITQSMVYGAIQAAWKASGFDHSQTNASNAETAESGSESVSKDSKGVVMDDSPVEVKING
ncbi:hypothetical protein lacNasYZ03_11820 [Lactobacillus nasalidis]|uniref:Phage holin n=1 Tax=Lactobacillus nasalidis TaxID=2797258 RepID=A0ABQ3W7S5_9LACO|nr:phage holin [Lactobacillus nasalidis]GHV97906.1 hypothetical protein lacNasYZ01_10880 [Lactobacillus nasalidis]GHW00136.1 hypothetical protein lacNasYZ02_15650 [Lactobacillus nasalidis]GHW01495.1 hypothetical protein lacNasYZ03_11820 [Lactobacillus nasalidis]